MKKFVASFLSFYITIGSVYAVPITYQGGNFFNILPGSVQEGDTLYGHNKLFHVLHAGSNGQVLTIQGGLPTYQNIPAGSGLPSQTGNSGKYLQTNGTSPSWSGNWLDSILTLQNSSDPTKQVQLSAGNLSTGTTTVYAFPFGASTQNILTDTATQSLFNKSFADASTLFFNNADPTKKIQFQLSGITTGTTRTLTLGDASGLLLTDNLSAAVQNKAFQDSTTQFYNTADNTKLIKFSAASESTGTTTTYTLPFGASTQNILTDTATQSFFNKTISGASNTITNVSLSTGVTGVLPAANGGIGFNGGTAVNGSLPIGNGAGFTNATLTAGSGVTITNGSGTITIASSSSGPSAITANQLPPKWVSATSFTMSNEAVYDSTGASALTSNTPATVIPTSNVVNGIAASSAFSGTVTTNGTTSVTGSGTSFTTQFIVGDVIAINGDDNYKITVVSSNTALTVSRNTGTAVTTYSRGGLATDTGYYLYAISQVGGASPGFLLSTRSISNGDTMVDLPSGYTLYRQLPFVQLTDNSSGSISGTKAGFLSFKVSQFGGGDAHIIWQNKGFRASAADTSFFYTTSMAAVNTNNLFTQIITNAPRCVTGITLSGRWNGGGDTPGYIDFSPDGVNSNAVVELGSSISTSPGYLPFTVTVPALLDANGTNTNTFYALTKSTSEVINLTITGYDISGIK